MDALRKKRIDDFFESIIDEKEFAKTTRRFVFESIKMSMIIDENFYRPDKEWITDGYSVLNELCEILDPILEDEPQNID